MRRAQFLAWMLLGSLPAAGAQQQPVKIDVVVRAGKRASGPDVVRLKKGDAVELTVTADAADELHLHGYDLTLKLQPGKPATLKFVAGRTGRFGAELHHAGADVVTLEIYPR
jgi:hypothetical protein